MNTEISNGTPTLSNPSTPSTLPAGSAPAVVVDALDAGEFGRAYNATANERAAIKPDEIVPINIDIQLLVTTVLAAANRIATIHSEIVDAVPAAYAARFAHLAQYAQALTHVQGLVNSATQPPTELPVLQDRAVKVRELLLAEATALVLRGYFDQKVLDGLAGTNGYANTTSDLNTLLSLFKRNWSKISGVTGLKASEFDDAMRLFEAMTKACAARAEQPRLLDEATDQRARAYTLVINAYDQARRSVMFVRWDAGDADTFVPSIFAGRATHPKKPAPTPEPVPTATTTTAAAPTTEPIHSDPNMPGGSPFAHN